MKLKKISRRNKPRKIYNQIEFTKRNVIYNQIIHIILKDLYKKLTEIIYYLFLPFFTFFYHFLPFFAFYPMTILLLIILLLAGVIMSGAILLMAPKGGLWFGLGGAAGSNEYGATKSVETGLKKVATICAVIFVVTSLIYPFTKEKKIDPNAPAGTEGTTPTSLPNFDLGSDAPTNEAPVVEVETK